MQRFNEGALRRDARRIECVRRRATTRLREVGLDRAYSYAKPHWALHARSPNGSPALRKLPQTERPENRNGVAAQREMAHRRGKKYQASWRRTVRWSRLFIWLTAALRGPSDFAKTVSPVPRAAALSRAGGGTRCACCCRGAPPRGSGASRRQLLPKQPCGAVRGVHNGVNVPHCWSTFFPSPSV